MVYNRIMEKLEKRLESLDNIVIENVLTKEDIESIYDFIDSVDDSKTQTQPQLGHKAFLVRLPEPIRIKLEKAVQDVHGTDWVLEAFQFARYSLEYGYVPKLYPHFDDSFSVHRLTLDLQIFGTKPWALVIEGRSITLKDNEALIFSGTSQIHWREPLEFEESDRFDMIFCHLHNVSDPDTAVSDQWLDYMNEKMLDWQSKVDINTGPLKLDV